MKPTKICPTCQTIFEKKPSDSKKYWCVKRYCCIECSGTLLKKGEHLSVRTEITAGSIGSRNLNYKGGRNIGKNGYVRVLIEGTGNYALEHRKVMENYLGRKLEKGEIVHHINHNRQDNRIENLEIMNKNDHDSMETKERWVKDPKSFNRSGGF